MTSNSEKESKKVTIKICLGSSCHLKGAYEMTRRLKEMIEDDPNVVLAGSLCMNNCANGVILEIDGKTVSKVTLDNLEEVVKKKIRDTQKRLVDGNETE